MIKPTFLSKKGFSIFNNQRGRLWLFISTKRHQSSLWSGNSRMAYSYDKWLHCIPFHRNCTWSCPTSGCICHRVHSDWAHTCQDEMQRQKEKPKWASRFTHSWIVSCPSSVSCPCLVINPCYFRQINRIYIRTHNCTKDDSSRLCCSPFTNTTEVQ